VDSSPNSGDGNHGGLRSNHRGLLSHNRGLLGHNSGLRGNNSRLARDRGSNRGHSSDNAEGVGLLEVRGLGSRVDRGRGGLNHC
jgi:hypothetical protein